MKSPLCDLIALSARHRFSEVWVARVANRPGLREHPHFTPSSRTPDARCTRYALAALGIIGTYEKASEHPASRAKLSFKAACVACGAVLHAPLNTVGLRDDATALVTALFHRSRGAHHNLFLRSQRAQAFCTRSLANGEVRARRTRDFFTCDNCAGLGMRRRSV